MSYPINPYVAGSAVGREKDFFGRQDIFEWVTRELRNPATNVLVLSGQRRIGKTSLLLQLEQTLPAEHFLPVYFDLQDQAMRPLNQVLVDLVDLILGRVGHNWGSLPSIIPIDQQDVFFRKAFIPWLYRELSHNRRLVLLLDEFDVLDQLTVAEMPDQAAAKTLFPFLRSMMNEDTRLAFVVAIGRRAEDLSLDVTATLKTSLVHEIWALDEKSARSLVRQAEANGTLDFTDSAVARILNLTSCHPYLTQLLCQRVWEQAYLLNPGGPPCIDVPEVDAAVHDVLEVGNQALIWLWNGLSPAEKIYAAALAEAADEENEIISEDKVLEVLMTQPPRLHTWEVELAPRDLVKRWVLTEFKDREYRFAVEIFRRWVRAHKPLRDVKDELDQLNPLAEQVFSVGLRVFRKNQWSDAVRYFRDALEKNPRHSRARLHLGEALIELTQLDEAVNELRQAYDQDRDTARLSLARALMARAKIREAAGDEEAALADCEQALQISPVEREAREKKSNILIRRGHTAIEQNQLDSAWIAYEQAGIPNWGTAIELIQSELEKNPTRSALRAGLVELLLDLDKTDSALSELDNLLTSQREYGEREDNVPFIERLLVKKPGCSSLRIRLGRLFLEMGQVDNALKELESAYAACPDEARQPYTVALISRAQLARSSGDWLSATDFCIHAMKIDPTQLDAPEIIKEAVAQLQQESIFSGPALSRSTPRPIMGLTRVDKYQLGELLATADQQIQILGVVALEVDWKNLARAWATKIKADSDFEVVILCESDNTLFSKSLTFDTDAAANPRNFLELQFVRNRAVVDFQDLLLEEGLSKTNKQVTIEITHLPIPVSIVRIDGRLFVNLWLHEIGDQFEEVVQNHPWHSHLEKFIATYFDPARGRKYACEPGAELLELYDHERVPRGIYPRNSFYDTDYSQRVVWAFIFDRQGRLLIHRRADNAKDNQGMWDKSVGGHIEFTDFNTSHSAYREVIEELFIAEPEVIKTSFKKWAISDEEIVYLGEWRPNQRKSHPFNEIRSFKREWAFFRFRESERLYSPRTLPDGTERRLRVIPDIFFFVAGPQLTDTFLEELKNSTFKLIELSELKNTMDRALSKKEMPGFDKTRLGEGSPVPKFSPDLINIMTGKLHDVLVEFSQYIKRYIHQP